MREIDSNHKEVEVDGFRYLITHPDPETAIKMGTELTKLISEPMAVISQTGGDKEKAAEAFPTAVRSLMAKIEPDLMYGIMVRTLKYVEVQGEVDGENKKILLDQHGIKRHFHGRTGAMIKVVSEALAFQQQDFFAAISDGIAGFMKKAN